MLLDARYHEDDAAFLSRIGALFDLERDVRFGSWAVKLTVSTCSPNCLTLRTFGKPLDRSRIRRLWLPVAERRGDRSKARGHSHAYPCVRIPDGVFDFRWQPGQSAASRDIAVKARRRTSPRLSP